MHQHVTEHILCHDRAKHILDARQQVIPSKILPHQRGHPCPGGLSPLKTIRCG
ncbi:MAG: hypothetical protein GQ541_06790 [Desulfovibrionaceae bacterium]|nr:hypothetical protein [Desulfovibrionaceae bacterium]